MIKLTTEADKICAAKAREAGQGHLFEGWDELSPEAQRSLLADIQSVDLQLLTRLLNEGSSRRQGRAGPRVLIPARPERLPTPELDPVEAEECRRLGEAALRNREVLLVTAAGGCLQPAFDRPVGCLSIGPVTGKPLFQLFAEKILAMSRRYRTSFRWTIVCHPLEREAITRFFKANGGFGIPAPDLSLCEQNLLPVVDRRGKILLRAPGQMVLEPSGHGGVLRRILEDGRLEGMESAGIRHILYFQVDNPLVRLDDPLFLGFHIRHGCEVTSKVVQKQCPDERVGVFARVGDVVHVVEHTHLPREAREAREPDGRLRFSAANLGVHVFSLEFLARLRREGCELPHHAVEKVTPCRNRKGEVLTPARPNGLRFVTYAFDAIPFARAARLVEVDRQEEFAPVKCPGSGGPTLDAARSALSTLYRRWVREAIPGAQLPEDLPVEISPLYAHSREELLERLAGASLPSATGGLLLTPRTRGAPEAN